MEGAPTDFFDVERERRSRIWLLFAALVGVFFAGVWLVTLCVGLAAAATIFDSRILWLTFTLPGLAALLLGSTAVAFVYWRLSRIGAQERLLRAMNAQPLDLSDRFHQRLKNIVEEMAVAGGQVRLRCVVVPIAGMNAFAFSDFGGGGTIGVTEGSLARLSREQLQGVVAHEVAHVLSGDCASVTAACLLFGVYTRAMAGLSELSPGVGDDRRAGGTAAAGQAPPLLLFGLLAVLAVATALINSAISRQREYKADAAAVRFTRDPLGLAQALGMMVSHPGGAGTIPGGLAALCIRPTAAPRPGLLERLLETHPPTDARIAVLLRFAASSDPFFAARSRQAEDTLQHREHAVATPAAGAAVGEVNPGLLASPSAAIAASGSGPLPSPVGPRCPSCHAILRRVDYEGVSLMACPACGGRLASQQAMARILARREVRFSDGQRRLAAFALAEGDQLRRQAILARQKGLSGLKACPLCGKTMVRRHYDLQHAVEVDSCQICGRVWFEKDELEVLQLLVEGELS